MSAAREAILGRVRRPDAAIRRQAAEAAMRRGERGPQPQISGDLLARFRAKAEVLASTSETLASLAEVPQAVARFLAAQQLGEQCVLAPELAALDWPAAGLQTEARAAVDRDTVGVTGAYLAIAETGTLMLLSTPQTPATISLLPETHIAVVDCQRIVATMEDAFARLHAELVELPRAVNFISGPSRTGDIEQTLVLGAHGPCRVHLLLVKSSEAL